MSLTASHTARRTVATAGCGPTATSARSGRRSMPPRRPRRPWTTRPWTTRPWTTRPCGPIRPRGPIRPSGRGIRADDAVHPRLRVHDLRPARQGVRRGPHLVEAGHANVADHSPHEMRSLRVLLQLQVDTEQAPERLLETADGAPPGRKPRPDLLSRRNDLRARGIHHIVTVPLDQGHHRGKPVEDGALARVLYRLDEALR